MTDKIVILSTCASEEEAERIARTLIEARLAACVNVAPGVRSFFHWQGKVQDARECLLVIKTSRELLERVVPMLEAAHSYELPEVLALPVIAGSTNYLDWMERELVG